MITKNPTSFQIAVSATPHLAEPVLVSQLTCSPRASLSAPLGWSTRRQITETATHDVATGAKYSRRTKPLPRMRVFSPSAMTSASSTAGTYAASRKKSDAPNDSWNRSSCSRNLKLASPTYFAGEVRL